LLLHRRTWSEGRVVSRAWLTHPGSRYRLGAGFEQLKPSFAAPLQQCMGLTDRSVNIDLGDHRGRRRR
jgi:hypothetical protein